MTDIDNNVPLPEKKIGAKRGRKKATAPEKEPTGVESLVKALAFIGNAQKPIGTTYQTHCILNAHWAVAFDGVLTIGCKIQEDVSACPKTTDFAAALSKCSAQVAISQLNEMTLAIRSGKFKASINCVAFADMPISIPDPMIAKINDEIKKGFEACGWLAIEGATDAFCASVLLQANSIVATNRHVMLEYWHGIDLPPGLLIPKVAVNAVLKTDKKLVGFGFSDTSATFYFEDESFLKTQLYKDRYPHYLPVFESEGQSVTPLTDEFFVALNSVAGFSADGFVFMRGDKLQSHSNEDQGACYELPGLPQQMSFNAEYLQKLAPHFRNVVFCQRKAVFANGMVRGAIMGGSHA